MPHSAGVRSVDRGPSPSIPRNRQERREAVAWLSNRRTPSSLPSSAGKLIAEVVHHLADGDVVLLDAERLAPAAPVFAISRPSEPSLAPAGSDPTRSRIPARRVPPWPARKPRSARRPRRRENRVSSTARRRASSSAASFRWARSCWTRSSRIASFCGSSLASWGSSDRDFQWIRVAAMCSHSMSRFRLRPAAAHVFEKASDDRRHRDVFDGDVLRGALRREAGRAALSN